MYSFFLCFVLFFFLCVPVVFSFILLFRSHIEKIHVQRRKQEKAGYSYSSGGLPTGSFPGRANSGSGRGRAARTLGGGV